MGDLEARPAHPLEDGGRRGAGGEEAHPLRQRFPLVGTRIQKHRHEDRRAAEVGDFVLGDQVVERLGAHLSQADVRSGLDADRPGKAPAVAMEHRQRPQIDRVSAHVSGDHVAHREQVGAPVVIDDAFSVAGRTRGAIQRNRVPLVERRGASIGLVALGDQRLVLDGADSLARVVVFRIVVIDDERTRLRRPEGRRDDGGEFGVDDERLRLAVVEHEGEAGVERVQHRPAHRHAVVAFEHRRRIGEHDRHRVAAHDPTLRQRGRELLRASVEVAVVSPEGPWANRQAFQKHLRGPLEECQRRQRLEVGGVSIEIAFVGRPGHGAPLVRILG